LMACSAAKPRSGDSLRSDQGPAVWMGGSGGSGTNRRGGVFGVAGRAVLVGLVVIGLVGRVEGGCYTAISQPQQGLCTDKYEVKVCAANQEAADLHVAQTHGVIVKANCKKALTILCGGVGGGEPSDDWADVCCRVANQCETDADCGDHRDPTTVPMCCDYCMGMYSEACESDEPVNAGFMSVGTLYHAFYGSDVWKMCHNLASSTGSSSCVEMASNSTRLPGRPCLGAPVEPAGSGEEEDSASSSSAQRVGGTVAHNLLMVAAALVLWMVQ